MLLGIEFKQKLVNKKKKTVKTVFFFERETGLEPATPTLARSCSTN